MCIRGQKIVRTNIMNLTNTIKWVATVVMLAGGIATSLQITPHNIYILNIASALFLWWSVRIKDKAMITVNVGSLLIYFAGTILTLL